jgi:large subunit ribosomal protein L18e
LTLLRKLKKAARENSAPIWRAAAEILSKPARRRVAVNVGKINRLTGPNDTVLVPGKVLAGGEVNHPITVAAFSFSESSVRKIEAAGGRAITIEELIRMNPRGSGVKLII